MEFLLCPLLGFVLMFTIANSKRWDKLTDNLTSTQHNLLAAAVVVLMTFVLFIIYSSILISLHGK